MQNPAKTEHMLGIRALFALIFIEGFVSISVEVLTIRQLIPVVGNSVIVTSLIIGIFLLFLALGYYRGGDYQRDYLLILQRNFAISAIMLGVGLSYVFIKLLFLGIHHYITHNTLIALILYLLLVTAPLIFILGQTVPITTNLFRHEHHVGRISGKVLFLSTLGSFLGAVLTAAVLMNWLGVAWTVMFNFLSLLVLILLCQWVTRKNLWGTLSVIIGGMLILWMNVVSEQSMFVRTTGYNNYMLATNVPDPHMGVGRALVVNGSPSSFLNDKKQGFQYIENIKNILFRDLGLNNKDILVIGAGGFTLTAQGDFGNHVTYIDIDPAIKPVSEQKFIDKIHGDFIAEDGRKFLLDKVARYDVIISDAYSNHQAIPASLLTQEHMANIRRALRERGLAVFNIIANPMLNTTYAKRVDNTIRSVFPTCTVKPSTYRGKVENMLYVCQKTPLDADKTIYTDNLNTITLDFYRRRVP